ncbi:MAG TPA: FtsX-like permease family protein [Candidatus Marinimicrobia bacterium]|nr:FtsX-like permease family protein [Candidatus Neomarinimicrobiota bacterium]
MNNRLLNWISFRYFRSKKQTGLISFTSYISIFGIALGCFALLISLSILNGFESEISARVIDLESHLRITGSAITDDTLDKIAAALKNDNPDIIYPFVMKKSILSNLGSEAVIRLKGIDSTIFQTKIMSPAAIMRGANHFNPVTAELPGIVVGYRLADKLGMFLGDTINVINPLDIKSSYSIPYVGRFVLSGVFRLDLFDYDENLAFIEIGAARRIYKMGDQYSGIDIRFDSYKKVNVIKQRLTMELADNYIISSWEDLHRDLFGAMKLEKYGSFLALSFIILIAIFNLTSSLVMLVMEKIREIGMLQTLGMNSAHIKGIFLRLGFITGSIGLLVGLLLATLLCLIQQHYKLIPLPSVYFIPYLPVELHLLDIAAILTAGLLLIFLGTLYPSQRVGKLTPLEAIQYEK